jgi:hypothetical protein
MTNGRIKSPKPRKVVMYEQLSRGQKAQLRATALFVIRSIVKKHGGTAEMDLETDMIKIIVPEKKRATCAQEIEKQVGATLKMLRKGEDDEFSSVLPL